MMRASEVGRVGLIRRDPMPLGRLARLCLVLVLPALALLALSCEDEEEEEGPPAASPTAAPEAGGAGPADGNVQVGSDIAYAPFEFFQDGTEIPDVLDIDIAKAVAEELGV